MNFLIAGSTGYIGSKLYSQLSDIDYTCSIDYNSGKIEKNFTKLDLIDINQVNRYAENCVKFDVLIFLVGLAHKKGKGKELSQFRNINKQTLVNLLSILEEKNKLPDKIIFASTISVYGEKLNQTVYTEDSDKNPFSPYAVTKLESEEYLLKHYSDKSWILRFAPVYSSDFLLNINRRIRMRNRHYRVGKGVRKFSLCNIENIKTVIFEIINGNVPAGIYNLSDSKEYSYNELLKKQQAKWILPIPKFIIKMAYVFGKVTGNIFLKENAVKLLTDNVYPSNKIRSHVNFSATLNNIN